MNELPFSAAADRNKGPILQVLRRVLPSSGVVLEVASGGGQHIVHFAAHLPALQFLPSEPEPQSRESIRCRIADAGLNNVGEPIALNVLEDWPLLDVDAVMVANLLHISAPQTLQGLLRGALAVMPRGGVLTIYGPFKRNNEHTAASNFEFDQSLRARNSQWGIRDLEAVVAAGESNSLRLQELVVMPANNFMLVFALAARLADQ